MLLILSFKIGMGFGGDCLKSVNTLLCFIAALACFLFVGACGSKSEGVSDQSGMKTETRKVDDFSSIQVNGQGDITVSVQEACSVTINAPEKNLASITTQVKDDALQISVVGIQIGAPKITIGLPKLETLDVAGAWKVKINDIKTPSLKLNIDGASNIICSGTCDDLVAELSGASELMAKSLVCKSCALNLEGACKAKVHVKDSLKLDASDASRVDVDGNPPSLTKNLSDAACLFVNGESGD